MADIQELDFSIDLTRSLLWQYSNAPNIISLVEKKNDWYNVNQTQFWENWLTDVFDLRTANAFGLSVWSIILGQSLFTTYEPNNTEEAFGFGIYNQGFDVGSFASDTGGNNVYSPAVARLLLQLRYFQLTSSGTVPETNRMLKYLFSGMGGAYLVDNRDMTQVYNMLFVIPAEMNYMLNNADVLPRPAGVQSTIVGF